MWTISLEKLPPVGVMLVYFNDGFIFEPYEVKDGALIFEGAEKFAEENPAVCHFFDENKEYRVIRRESHGDILETVFTAEEESKMDTDLLYSENHLVKEEYRKPGIPEKLTMISRYHYLDNDVFELESYRIALPKLNNR